MKTGGTEHIDRHGPGFRMFAAIYGRPDPQRLALGGSVEIRGSIAYAFTPDGEGLANYLASFDPDQGPEHLLSVARAFFQGRVPRFSLIVRVPDAEGSALPSLSGWLRSEVQSICSLALKGSLPIHSGLATPVRIRDVETDLQSATWYRLRGKIFGRNVSKDISVPIAATVACAPSLRRIIAYVDRAAVGIASYDMVADIGVLSDIGVLPNYRRRGIARCLVGNATVNLRAGSAEFTALLAQSHALGFYQSLGFTPVAKHRPYVHWSGLAP